MEDTIHERIIGQKHAVKAVSKQFDVLELDYEIQIDLLQVLFLLDQLVLVKLN
jgi:ATP-dependent Clp protease ATP-binding subunit ClpA